MSSKKEHRKVAGAALIGNAVEWYDFYIYGTCTALIFPAVFFPNVSPAMGLIIALASYGVGFIARPLGAIIFGHFGDKIGRRKVLMASLLMMGGTTFTIGLLPSYAEWGVASAIILCFLRLLQGLAVGGEWGSAAVMATEHAPSHRKALFGSLVQIGSPIGLLLSTGAFALIYAFFNEAEILAWAWRLPFLASVVMIAIGIYIRLNVKESPEFEKIKRQNAISEMPIRDVIKEDGRMVLRVGLSRVFQNLSFNTFTIFYLGYASQNLGLDKTIPLTAIMIATSFNLFHMPFWANLSDIIGRRTVALIGAYGSMAFVFPAIMLIQTKDPVYVMIALIVGYLLGDISYSVQAAHITEQFGTKTRLTGTNLGYNIGGMVAGLFMPLMGVVLAWQGNIYHVGILLTIVAIVGAYNTLPETLTKRIKEEKA